MSVTKQVMGLFLALASFIVPTQTLAVERIELQKAWPNLLCHESSDQRPSSLWEAGVFDAQVEGRSYEPKAGAQISTKDLARKARSMAKAVHHRGHAFGHCKNGKAWSVSTPAPRPLIKTKTGYKLPIEQLNSSCQAVQVAFIPRFQGAARLLRTAGYIETKGLGDGLLSVECTPKRPRWLGKQVWFLAPVGNGPGANPPYAELLTDQSPSKGLLQWIHAIRRDAGVPSLLPNEPLAKAASFLAISQQINHDRHLLKKVALDLDAQKITFLGEDRVAAPSLGEAAWLLWNSPSHRTLLLNPKAAHIGTALTTRGSEIFAVITLGHSHNLTTAKSSSPAKAKAN